MRKPESTSAPDREDSRLRLLFLYQMLRKETDEQHLLSSRQIMEKMKTEHGITMHRTTLPRDIEILRRAEIEVMVERKRALWYWLPDGPFSIPELRLLIDAVLSSKFIPEGKSRQLMKKNKHQTDPSQLNHASRRKTNRSIFRKAQRSRLHSSMLERLTPLWCSVMERPC